MALKIPWGEDCIFRERTRYLEEIHYFLQKITEFTPFISWENSSIEHQGPRGLFSKGSFLSGGSNLPLVIEQGVRVTSNQDRWGQENL